jgi:threonylcarbamoyladenosine tRNA methylthiotransferase MtaB
LSGFQAPQASAWPHLFTHAAYRDRVNNMTFFIYTTGCKANQWDSHVIADRLKAEGLSSSPMERADFIVINACALTDNAEKDARRFVNRARSRNPLARVMLVGCHAQAYPDVTLGADTLLGQNEKFDTGKFLGEKGCFVEKTRIFAMDKSPEGSAPSGRTRFFFKIQDGCDRFCAYCVVPYARGMARSRPMDEILQVMVRLRKRGVKEVVLTGIEISSYSDPATGLDLKGLLRLLEGSDTPPRIRISSVDPLYLDDDFIELVAGSGKVAKSLHIPLQSASDRILRKMGRQYTQAFMRDLLDRVDRRIDNIGIGMDVLVGFPGEDEDAFRSTQGFLEESDISYLHIFPFSARAGTRAAAMDDQVADTIKRARVRTLKKLDASKRQGFRHRFLGTEAWIIPEGKLYGNTFMRGYTDNYLPVYVPYNKTFENELIKVTIERIEAGMAMGKALNTSGG